MPTKSENPAGTNLEKKFNVVRQQIGEILGELADVLKSEYAGSKKLDTLRKILVDVDSTRRKWEAQRFQVAVLALVKAGKTTLINAWLGDEYLPSSNVPETAHIVRTRHAPHDERGTLYERDVVRAVGARDINDYLRGLNAHIREKETFLADDELVLEAPLTALVGKPLGDQGFEILDTPGPNDAGAEGLRMKVERLLDEVDVIVYLLDYSKLKQDDEREVLVKLASIRPELLRRYTGRLFFVVNKIDQKNRNSPTLEETADYVADLLNKQIEGLTITPDRVLLVSAENALLARLVQSGRASDAAVSDFAERALGQFAQSRTREDCLPFTKAMLDFSRLPQLENEIISYIYQQRGRLLLDSLLDDLERQLNSLHNHLSISSQTLQTQVAEMEVQVKQLRAELKRITDEIENAFAKFEGFKSGTEEWVRRQFESFQEEVDWLIREALLNSKEAEKKMKERGRTQFRRFVSSFLDSIQDLVQGPERSSQEDVLRDVKALNKRIGNYLRGEFEHFRADLELRLRDRQKEFFQELKELVQPLVRQIERRVGETLNIKLRASTIKFPADSLEGLHQDIERSINTLVQKREDRREVKVTKTRKTKDAGWCTDAEYEQYQATEYQTVTKHVLAIDQVQKLWSQQIRSMTNTSVLTARHVIEEKIGRTIDSVAEQLRAYAEGFVNTIEREIEESRGGEAQRAERLREVGGRAEQVARLSERLKDCRQFLN
jgi:small GTP-binding protein